MTRVKPEFIKNLQGRDFVLFTGLLDLAHDDGLSSVETELLQAPTREWPVAIVRARVTTSKGTYSGIGDASPDNVNKMIAAHAIRMAETRAVARALRLATNVGITAFEELGGDDHDDHPKRQPSPAARETVIHNEPAPTRTHESDALDNAVLTPDDPLWAQLKAKRDQAENLGIDVKAYLLGAGLGADKSKYTYGKVNRLLAALTTAIAAKLPQPA